MVHLNMAVPPVRPHWTTGGTVQASALPGLEPRVPLVDDEDAAVTADDDRARM
jgi:hypothetical protein